MNFLGLTSIIFVFIILSGCSKDAGLGGNSSIVGKINLAHYTSDYTSLSSTEPAMDEYVYIIFGDQPGYGSRVKTAYDGSFEFNNLTIGKYQIYIYSKDSSSAATSGIIPVTKEIEITSKKEIQDAGTLVMIDNDIAIPPVVINYTASITGKVKEIDINTNEEYYIGDQRVYLIYENEINYATSVKTNYNGEYQFGNLHPGTYTLYTYSKDVFDDYPGPDYAVTLDTVITTNDQTVQVADLIIYR